MLTIDGSKGEGGGQVLRTSLTLSILTQTPFVIENIRAHRAKPGLLRQHLAAVESAGMITGAKLEGASLGSMKVSFDPTQIVNPTDKNDFEINIGSAGSTSLVVQTVLPVFLFRNKPSCITVKGGTHNPSGPPYEFLRDSFLPQAANVGVKANFELISYGFFPSAGGELKATVEPSTLVPWTCLERGKLLDKKLEAIVSLLPATLGKREVETCKDQLGWRALPTKVLEVKDPKGLGNCIYATLTHEHTVNTFASFGSKKIKPEEVATKLVEEVHEFVYSDATVGEHLADQMLLLLAIGKGGSFAVSKVSGHLKTQADIIETFLGKKTRFDKQDKCVVVSMGA